MGDMDDMTRLPPRPAEKGAGERKRAGLVFLSGPRLDEEVWCDGDAMRIGRDPSQNDLVLEDPNVSRAHAVLQRRGDVWYLHDRESTHGTWMNGRKISECAMQEGAVVEFAGVRFRFVLEGYVDRFDDWSAPVPPPGSLRVTRTYRAGADWITLSLGDARVRLSMAQAKELEEKLRRIL